MGGIFVAASAGVMGAGVAGSAIWGLSIGGDWDTVGERPTGRGKLGFSCDGGFVAIFACGVFLVAAFLAVVWVRSLGIARFGISCAVRVGPAIFRFVVGFATVGTNDRGLLRTVLH